ncbi:MAG: hypothetical protein U0Q55_12120 [Vicinamibacterales bacterium]
MRLAAWLTTFLLASVATASAQPVTQRGFVDVGAVLFPQAATNDRTRAVGDLLVRDEVTARPASWFQLASGVDVRANTHSQVDRAWRVDVDDRGALRPAISIRRLAATIRRGALTVDVGKQFIRWGKADIVTPTDHLAPRDFVNVITSDFLAVWGARGQLQAGSETLDVVWVPRLTPSRMPLVDQRWTVVPSSAAGFALEVARYDLPTRDQAGVRWGHTGGGYELSASYFDGFNHLPLVSAIPAPGVGRSLLILPTYPRIRSVGADAAIPTRWLTLKGEVASVTSVDERSDDYLLYVIQVERQTGEWLLLGGYAGEVVTERRTTSSFAPDRGLTRAFVARASYTIDSTRSMALEGAVRQNGNGFYAKGEYSQSRGAHWRTTVTGVLLAGADDDFLGQYRRNSNVTLSLRYSF